MHPQEAKKVVQQTFSFLFEDFGFVLVEAKRVRFGVIVVALSQQCKIVFHYEAAWGIYFGLPRWQYEDRLGKWIPYLLLLRRVYGGIPLDLQEKGVSHNEYLRRIAKHLNACFAKVIKLCVSELSAPNDTFE